MGLVWCCRERRDVSLNQEKAGLIRPKEDASTKSYISNEGEESPVVIANIDFDDMNDSAEKLNNKEIL